MRMLMEQDTLISRIVSELSPDLADLNFHKKSPDEDRSFYSQNASLNAQLTESTTASF